MNYAELTAAIKAYAENYDTGTGGFIENIPVFVQNAEERIYNIVQLPALRKNVTGTMTAGNKYVGLPSDWLATFSIAAIKPTNEYLFLLNKDVNFMRESYPDTDAAFYGEPKYYAIFDSNSMIVAPTPDANYEVELHYFYYPESIVTAGTSWLGDNFESALLYGSLLEAAAYMKSNPDTISNYMARYNEAITLLKQLGDGKDRRDAYRNGQVRDPVR
jgi:hypothetical protein